MKMVKTMVATGALLMTAGAAQAQQYDILTGDQGTACEVVLCLAAGSAPHECDKPLRRYFSIRAHKPSDLRKKRRNFLNMCPDQDQSLVQSLVNGQCNPAFQECATPGGSGNVGGGGGGRDDGRPQAQK